MINFKEGKIWQKLKVLTKEPGQKEVILNLVVKEEEELNKLGKNNPLITFFIILTIFYTVILLTFTLAIIKYYFLEIIIWVII